MHQVATNRILFNTHPYFGGLDMVDCIDAFITEFPDLYRMLLDTSHNIPKAGYISRYHNEDSIWDHILLMRTYLEDNRKQFEDVYDLMKILILLHDVGKIYTKQIIRKNDGSLRTVFSGHAGFSTIQAHMILNKLAKNKHCDLQISNIRDILTLVNWHDDVWKDVFDSNRYPKYLGYLMNRFSTIDSMGVISDSEGKMDSLKKIESRLSIDQLNDKPVHYDWSNPRLILLIGAPCSGKTTYIKYIPKSEHIPVFSSDDLIEQEAKNRGITYNQLFGNKTYISKVMNQFTMSTLDQIESRKDLIIDRTNADPSSRYKFVSLAKKYGYYIEAFVFLTDYETLKSRNVREGKLIPMEVIDNFIQKLTIPYQTEVDRTFIISNRGSI